MSSPPSVTPSFTRPRVYTLSPDWSRIFTLYMHHMEQDIVNCSSTQLLKIVVDCPTLLISRHQCCECCEFFLPFPSRHIGEEKRGEMSSMMSPAPLSHPTILVSIVPLLDVPPLDECSVDMRTPSYTIYGQCHLCCIDAE